MLWLAQLHPLQVVIASVAWAALIVALPRLTLLAFVLRYRAGVWLSGARNYGGAFGGAHWRSRRAMLLSLAIPPALLLLAWTLARLTHPAAGP